MLILQSPEDLQWLRDTHLKGRDVPPFVIAILQGNEDSPIRIELYATNHYKCVPFVVELD